MDGGAQARVAAGVARRKESRRAANFLTPHSFILFWRHSSAKEHSPGQSRLSSTMGGQDEEACTDTVGRRVSFRDCRHRLGTILLWWRLLLSLPLLWRSVSRVLRWWLLPKARLWIWRSHHRI